MNKLSILHRDFLNSKVKILAPRKALMLPESSTVEETVNFLKQHAIGGVLIGQAVGVEGIFTERDVLKFLATNLTPAALKEPVASLCTKNLVSLKPTASIARLIHTMATGGMRHIPIIDSSSVAIISMRDVLRFIYERITSKIANLESVVIASKLSVDGFFENNVITMPLEKGATAPPGTSLQSCLDRMVAGKSGSIVIIDSEMKVSGIFTERDFVRKASLGEVSRTTEISKLMTPSPKTAQSSMSIAFAMNLMFEGGYRHIPVVDLHERYIGILSVRSFLRVVGDNIVADLSRV